MVSVAANAYSRDGAYYQGVEKASAGYKLMASMGWTEGDGLGANKQGIKEHVKVKKKFDNAGVGKTEADSRTRDWTLGMVAYDRVLSGLTEITSKHANSNSDSECSDASGGEEALPPAKRAKKLGDGESRKGEKKGRKEARKGKGSHGPAAGAGGDAKTARRDNGESKGKAVTFAEVPQAVASSSGSDSDSDAVEVPAPPVRRRVTHVGRFAKREAAKAVRGYSSSDLAAIIGCTETLGLPAPEPLPTLCIVNAAAAAPLSGSEDEGDNERAASGGGASTSQQRADGAGAGTAAAAWWASYFVRAGRLGAAARLKGGKVERGFSEQDQVDLYTLNKQAERNGKQGLGVRGALKKVAGARWAGTKTKLGSDSEDEGNEAGMGCKEEEAEQEVDEQEAQRRALGGLDGSGIVILPPLRPKPAATATVAAVTVAVAAVSGTAGGLPGAGKRKKQKDGALSVSVVPRIGKDGTGAAGSGKFKWRKVVCALLAAAPGGAMKLSKLQRKALAAAGAGEAAAPALLATLTGSSKFVIDGKVARLKA